MISTCKIANQPKMQQCKWWMIWWQMVQLVTLHVDRWFRPLRLVLFLRRLPRFVFTVPHLSFSLRVCSQTFPIQHEKTFWWVNASNRRAKNEFWCPNDRNERAKNDFERNNDRNGRAKQILHEIKWRYDWASLEFFVVHCFTCWYKYVNVIWQW